MAEIRRAQAALDGCGALVLPLHGDLPPDATGPRAAPGRHAPRRAGDLDRRDLADRPRRAHRGRWRLAARAAARSGHRPDPADHAAHLPRRRRAARRPRRPRGAGRRDPAVDHRAASRPAGVRPAGNPGGGAVVAGAGLRRLGHAARPTWRSRTSRPPARWPRRAALLAELGALDADGRITEAGRRMAHARRASAAGRDDAGGRNAGARRRWPPTSPRCWRSATRCARRTRRPTSALRLAADRRRRSGRRPRRAVAHPPRRRAVSPPPAPAARHRAPPAIPAPLLAAGFPDRIAQRRGEPGTFRLSGGGGARLPRTDPLANAPLLVGRARWR